MLKHQVNKHFFVEYFSAFYLDVPASNTPDGQGNSGSTNIDTPSMPVHNGIKIFSEFL
jgi:hypothetical protein